MPGGYDSSIRLERSTSITNSSTVLVVVVVLVVNISSPCKSAIEHAVLHTTSTLLYSVLLLFVRENSDVDYEQTQEKNNGERTVRTSSKEDAAKRITVRLRRCVVARSHCIDMQCEGRRLHTTSFQKRFVHLLCFAQNHDACWPLVLCLVHRERERETDRILHPKKYMFFQHAQSSQHLRVAARTRGRLPWKVAPPLAQMASAPAKSQRCSRLPRSIAHRAAKHVRRASNGRRLEIDIRHDGLCCLSVYRSTQQDVMYSHNNISDRCRN